MLYDILPIILIVTSLAVIVFILARKVSYVSMIDIKKIPREVQSEVKKSLIERKIERKLSNIGIRIKPFGDKISKFLGKFLGGFKRRIKEWERKYRQERRKAKKVDVEGARDEETGILLEQARELVSGGRLDEAEKKYLELINLDNYNIVAYVGLAEIYYRERELDGAREVMEYVVKLANHGYGELEASDYILLALIYQDLGREKEAFKQVKEAVKLEPNNPRNLDLLCKISIIIKNKREAVEACGRLAEVNPENEKVKEYRREIRKM